LCNEGIKAFGKEREHDYSNVTVIVRVCIKKYYAVCGLMTGLGVELQESAMQDTVISGRMQNSRTLRYFCHIYTVMTKQNMIKINFMNLGLSRYPPNLPFP
jgi:hypothetical protein